MNHYEVFLSSAEHLYTITEENHISHKRPRFLAQGPKAKAGGKTKTKAKASGCKAKAKAVGFKARPTRKASCR